jgi:hypothetical protein
LALAVPLSRFTSRVGGGSAFYVRRICVSLMTLVAPRLRFVMLTSTVLSVGMTWGPVVAGLVGHPIRTHDFFSTVGLTWIVCAVSLALVALVASIVSLLRRDWLGFIGLVAAMSVLTSGWSWYIPVV